MGINENVLKKALTYDIWGNSMLSDTIIFVDNRAYVEYLNTATRKTGDRINCVEREGHNYIFVDKHSCTGYLAKYIEEYDVLLVAFYSGDFTKGIRNSLNNCRFSWKEEYRSVIGRDSAMTFKGSDETHPYVLSPFKNADDLCGQLLFDDEPHHSFNMPGASGEEIRKFCKGVWWRFDVPYTFHGGNSIIALISTASKLSLREQIETGIREYYMDGIRLKEFWLPKKPMGIIEECLRRCFDLTPYEDGGCNFIKGMLFGYLQNCDGEYVLRKFTAFINGRVTEACRNTPIGCLEIERIHITKDVLEYMDILRVPLIYFDREGIENSIFKHAVGLLEDAERNTRIKLTWVCRADASITDNDDALKSCCINFACAFSFVPLIEKLYNMLRQHDVQGNITMLMDIASKCRTNLWTELNHELGELYFDKNELNQALGIPKRAMNELAKNRLFIPLVNTLKSIFIEDTEYLMDMDECAISNLISFLYKNYCTHPFANEAVCLSMLVSIFGAHNIQGYLKFLDSYGSFREQESYLWITEYIAYLKKLMVLRNYTGGFQWKLKGEELRKADESITPAYTIMVDSMEFSEKKCLFEAQSGSWEYYVYENAEFIVSYPKEPAELVREGVMLHHCVKEFINKVANGETIIMFIRRPWNPLKPFYTLEIRNGSVRQCHGHSNSNADECIGLHQFLDEYCNIKGLDIDWDSVNRRLQA